jgi:hypothetical protein
MFFGDKSIGGQRRNDYQNQEAQSPTHYYQWDHSDHEPYSSNLGGIFFPCHGHRNAGSYLAL